MSHEPETVSVWVFEIVQAGTIAGTMAEMSGMTEGPMGAQGALIILRLVLAAG